MERLPRYEVESGINACLLIRDTHSSDLTSLTKHALGFLEQQSANQNRRRTLIVSDIAGNELVCEMFYANLMQVVATEAIDRLVLIGVDLSLHEHLFKIADKHVFATTDDFLSAPLSEEFANEVLLLKIAPEYNPERILSHLQQLAHDTVLEIDFDAMFHNMDYFRSKLNRETKMMCMVKASAYGSGSIEVAQAMQHRGCDYLGVAFVNEGVELRQAGIQLPILVLDPMEPALHQLFKFELEPEICSFRMLNLIIAEAQSRGLTDYPVHIKLDTGMHRAGFMRSDLARVADILKSQTALRVVSIFSHLAAADELIPSMYTFTLQQIARFETLSDLLIELLGYRPMRHILNTAGIERFADYQFDMVRLGIGLWGMNCENQSSLRSVCSLSTRIIQLKEVKKGDTIGYGRRWTCPHDSQIALLPLGYADGIDRRFSNGVGKLYYNGIEVPIVGNVCMDLIMVDVTGLAAHEGDEVVLFDQNHPISEMSDRLGTIPYEILSSISPRVRRVYFRH